VQDEEPKYGLAVYGEVDADKIWRTAGAREGDVLILTKPLGTGIAVTGIKAGMIDNPRAAEEAERWMTTLNALPPKLSDDLHRTVHAATDVTGFGLVGHILDMLSEGNLNLRLELKNVPLLPGILDLADTGMIPEGTYRNRIAYEDRVQIEGEVREARIDLLFDAQTSGGLLLAVSPEEAEKMLKACQEAGFFHAAVIGGFSEGDGKIKACRE
jgi:selenide,water dikinase